MSDSVLEVAILDGATMTNATLPELEQVIERGQQTFIEVGRALLEIRDRRLYRETHATFETYCCERWGWNRRYANRQIDAARVADVVGPTGPKPESEREARAMLDQLEPEERKAVRRGDAMPETVAKMTEPASAYGAGSKTKRLPGLGSQSRLDAARVVNRVIPQVRGLTLALQGLDFAGCRADKQAIDDLTACIRALYQLRTVLKKETHV